MSIGHRIFVIEEQKLNRISQKLFYAFVQEKRPVLKQFANHQVTVAMVFYTLKKRHPEKIVRIDTMKMRVCNDGSINEEFWMEGLKLATSRIDFFNQSGSSLKSKPESKDNRVIDAKSEFDRRRNKNHFPDLSAAMARKIKITLLGNAH